MPAHDSHHSAPLDHTPHRSPAAGIVRVAGEVVLLAILVLAPWPFASNKPPFESALSAGVLLLTSLWAIHAALTGRFRFRLDIVSTSLVGLMLWSAAQLIPLPESVVAVLSPQRLVWHQTLLPEQSEALPGEQTEALARPTVLTLSVNPSETQTFLIRVLGIFVVYATTRNWLASREGFRRLAWVLTGTGVALAVFALGQFFSSPPNVMYWSVSVGEGSPFGPFICRNHYADYAAICLGMAVGLLLPQTPNREDRSPGQSVAGGEGPVAFLLTPRNLGLAAAAGLITVSIAFSLSRGAMLSVLVAGIGGWALTRFGRAGRQKSNGAAWFVLLTTVAAATTAAFWFGTDVVEQRVASIGTAEAAASRLPLWRDVVRLIPEFWSTGTGDGTFVWVEPTVRADRPAVYYFDHAHNEYLEALIEGGVVRFGFTLALVVGLLMTVGRGFLRRRDRSVGPLLLGAWFGLAVGVCHCAVDFAIHLPAVAVVTAAVAGYAAAAATDGEFVPSRQRGQPVEGGSTSPSGLAPGGLTARRWAATGAGLIAPALALVVALDARGREQAHRLQLAADLIYWESTTPDRLAQRTTYLDARVGIRPTDPVVLFDAAQGHIDAAVEATLAMTPSSAPPPTRFPQRVVDRHLIPALRYLQAARAANPIDPRPHARFGLYADYFARSEPAGTHFDRAKRLLPADPDIWFVSGKQARQRGESAAAWGDWKRSLSLSPTHMAAILAAAREELTPAQIRDWVLPEDAVTLVAAADQLFPNRETCAADRRPFLEAAVAAWQPGQAPEYAVAVARAFDELGRPDEAYRAWRTAVDLAPASGAVRDGYSRWLEREERYEEAIVELEWLKKQGGGPDVQDRLDAARHGLKLRNGIAPK